MKKTLVILLIVMLFTTSFVYALNDNALTIEKPENIEIEKSILKERTASAYLQIGTMLSYENLKHKYENQLQKQKEYYENKIEQYQYKITNLEIVLSHDYENYAWWFYDMSCDQFLEFCAVVQAEGMSYKNQVAITQTAINLAIAFGNTPYYWMCQSGAYTSPTTSPLLQSTIDTVTEVFLEGAKVTSRPIKYFYSYSMMPEGSCWHEQQTYVMTIDDHYFYE